MTSELRFTIFNPGLLRSSYIPWISWRCMSFYIRCFPALLSPRAPRPSFCIRRELDDTPESFFLLLFEKSHPSSFIDIVELFLPHFRGSYSHVTLISTHHTMPDPVVDLARSRTTTTLQPSESSASGFRRVIDVPPDNGKKKRGGLFKRRPDPSEYRDPYEQVGSIEVFFGRIKDRQRMGRSD
jgi:hypothetical protein